MLISEIERNDKFSKFSKPTLQAPGSTSLSVPLHYKEESSFEEALAKKRRAVVLSVGNRRRRNRRNSESSPTEQPTHRTGNERREAVPVANEKNIAVVAFEKNEFGQEGLKPGDTIFFNSNPVKAEVLAAPKPAPDIPLNTDPKNVPDSLPDYIVDLSGKPSTHS